MYILILAAIYYLIGIEYSYQAYNKFDAVESIRTPKDIFISLVVIPTLWIVLSAQRKFKQAREWYHYKNDLRIGRINPKH